MSAETAGMDLPPSLHVQLGTTMSLTASRPRINEPPPQAKPDYGQLAAFSVPISSSSTINITVPESPQPPSTPHSPTDTDIYASYIPVQPPSPKPDYTSRVSVEPTPPPPPTKPKPQVQTQGPTRSNLSSAGSVTSSGIGSIPSSPMMRTSTNRDLEADTESFTWSSLDDTRSERSFNSSGGGSSGEGLECDSACSVGSPEVERDDIVTFDRVGLTSDGKIAIIVQLACESDEGCSNINFIELVSGVTKAVFQYFKKKEALQETMNATQINQLIMGDRRPVKEHIAEVSQTVEEAVTVTKADCRRVNSKGYVGTYVLDNVVYKDNTVVAKTGVIVVLKKLNKFACSKEFSEQLSLHILAARPEVLGKKEQTTTVDRLGRKNPQYARALQTQRFYCDQTCNVYEAARRSFVEVTDFVLYG